MLPAVPIIVIKQDKKLLVLDGQHRLTAAKRLNVPIFYIASEDITLDDIPTLNKVRTPWTLLDFVNHYVACGNVDYEIALKFMTDHPHLSLNFCVASLTSRAEDGTVLKLIKNGTFKVTTFERAEYISGCILDFKKYFKYYNNRYFTRAISFLIRKTPYDHKIMMDKLDYESTRLVRCLTVDDYLKLLEEIYNYKNSPKNFVTLTLRHYVTNY